MSNEKEKSKEKENISIVVDPKTDQFVVYRSGFSLVGVFFLSYLLLSCLGNKGVEERVSKETSPQVKQTTSAPAVKKEPTKSSEQDASSRLAKPEKSKSEEKPKQKAKKINTGGPKLVTSPENRELAKRMRELLYHYGSYQKAIALSKKSKDPLIVYYRGIAYFSMMVSTKMYSPRERRNFRKNALSIFKEVARKTKQPELEARALLWHAIARDLTLTINKKLPKEKMKIVADLRDIRAKFPKSSVANDALLYEGDLLTSINRKKEATAAYKKLLSQSFSDEVVYDRYANRVVSQKKAVEYGLRRVARR